jgi:choline dehydrogenase-like flavoprotein
MTTEGETHDRQRFDFDGIVISSGFGGSVAALRATEKGYRVGAMESGKGDILDSDMELPGIYNVPLCTSRTERDRRGRRRVGS